MPALNNILFLDIETVPQYASYELLPDEAKLYWNKKTETFKAGKLPDDPEALYPRAGIYAEFGKIACISCGVISGCGNEKRLTIKSFCCEEEENILQDFCTLLGRWSGADKVLCAHNGKEFDFPYISRRMIINGMHVPCLLQLSGKKPWEIQHMDTLDMWKFGDYKHYTSLSLLAHVFGIPTPKDDIDGSMVWDVYWNDKDLHRIVTYCQKDVITLAQVYLRMTGETVVKPENIRMVNSEWSAVNRKAQYLVHTK